MRWLKRWQASKMHPLGPDFDSAPWMEFDLSGTKVKFKCPRHEVVASRKQCASSINIYDEHTFDAKGSQSTGLHMLYRGWGFWDRPFGEKKLGYVAVHMALVRKLPQVRQYGSFFIKENLTEMLLNRCESSYGKLNREMWDERDSYEEEVVPENDFWRYPTKTEEIECQNSNGLHWCHYSAYVPNYGPERKWCTPISDDHFLVVSFEAHALDREYFSPSHDIDNAVLKAIREFIANFHLKLSPDAERCKARAIAEEHHAESAY